MCRLFGVVWFDVIMQINIINILQDSFTNTYVISWLFHYQWCDAETVKLKGIKHNTVQIICIMMM